MHLNNQNKYKKHILVIDDDTRLRELLRRFLQENDFRVSTAKNTTEAREIMKLFIFDLLVVDIMMPEENGIDFTNDIRKFTNIPILMLTAMGEPENRISGLESGADDYLTKPFEPKELLLRIKNILKRIPSVKEENKGILKLGLCSYDTENSCLLNLNPLSVHHFSKIENCIRTTIMLKEQLKNKVLNVS